MFFNFLTHTVIQIIYDHVEKIGCYSRSLSMDGGASYVGHTSAFCFARQHTITLTGSKIT